ncbi:hypothetical protein ACFQY0_17565 [Haloferula chungangensis]|uniref:Uncharacterized protein n=2 Tax=Haloferula chungangensis TaxID=1048331 RepID=A0ABW2LB35_9BACT
MKVENSNMLPDTSSVASELTFEDSWDSTAVSGLIRSKCSFGETPAFLFLGRKETELLREHLASAFGRESVITLHDSYFMGLEVVELNCDSFVHVAGRKTSRVLQDPIARRPEWRDRQTDALWGLRL